MQVLQRDCVFFHSIANDANDGRLPFPSRFTMQFPGGITQNKTPGVSPWCLSLLEWQPFSRNGIHIPVAFQYLRRIDQDRLLLNPIVFKRE